MPQGEAAQKHSKASPKRRRSWKAHAFLPEASLKAYAFFASVEEVYTSLGKRARVEGRLREKEEKEKPKEKEEK